MHFTSNVARPAHVDFSIPLRSSVMLVIPLNFAVQSCLQMYLYLSGIRSSQFFIKSASHLLRGGGLSSELNNSTAPQISRQNGIMGQIASNFIFFISSHLGTFPEYTKLPSLRSMYF